MPGPYKIPGPALDSCQPRHQERSVPHLVHLRRDPAVHSDSEQGGLDIQLENDPQPTANAHQALGGVQLFALAFGAIIGVSWILLVGEWLLMAGTVGAVLAFLVGGLAVLMVAYFYAELGSLYPEAGGELVYAFRLLTPGVAFFAGWLLLLVYLSLVAFETISVIWLIGVLIPSIQGPVLYEIGGTPLHLGALCFGLFVASCIAWINARGAKSTGRLQDLLTLLLIIAALVFVAAGMWSAEATNFQPLFGTGENPTPVMGFILLLGATPLFYAGFGVIPQAMGEARREELGRLGRLMLIVIAAAMLFYSLVVLAVAGLLPHSALASLEMPAADAFRIAFNSEVFASIVLLAGLMGLVTTWNAVFFAAVRVMAGMARFHLLPAGFGQKEGDAGPNPRVIVLVLMVSILGAFLGRSGLLPIVSVSGACITLLFLIVCLSSRARRKHYAHVIPPYLAPGGSILLAAASLFTLVMICLSVGGLVWQGFKGQYLEILVLTFWLVIGFGVFKYRHMRIGLESSSGASRENKI